MQLSRKIQNVAASPTLALNTKAKEMKAKGIDVVNFTAGEPDFDTPENIKNAAIKALHEGFTKYTPATGIPELKEAIAKKLREENGIECSPQQIVVSCGGKHSLYNLFQALCNPGDEVIIPSPYWVTYPEQVKLADAKPVIVETKEENGFELLASDVEKKISGKTKIILINSPSNPTGAVYSKQELEKIASIAVENDTFVISDEIYEHFTYEGQHVSIASFNDKIKERTITVNGASKPYAMTGWRIGWAAGPMEVMQIIGNFQSQTTSNPTSIAQKAYLEALSGPQDSVKRMAAEFRKRREIIVNGLNGIEGITCVKPKGAFYVFPNVSGCFKGDIKNSMDFAMKLLEEGKVGTVPGSAFGAEGYVRMSYACSLETIKLGLERMQEFVKG